MALGSRLGDERHGAVGRVEMWKEQQVQAVPGCPRGILGEATSRHLEKGPENLGERSGREEEVPETSEGEETNLPW